MKASFPGVELGMGGGGGGGGMLSAAPPNAGTGADTGAGGGGGGIVDGVAGLVAEVRAGDDPSCELKAPGGIKGDGAELSDFGVELVGIGFDPMALNNKLARFFADPAAGNSVSSSLEFSSTTSQSLSLSSASLMGVGADFSWGGLAIKKGL